MKLRASALAAILAFTAPAFAHACSVCGLGAADRSNFAYLISTLFLSLLPLGAIIGGLVWLARHARAAMADEFVDRDEAAVSSGVSRAPQSAPTAVGESPLLGGAGR